VVDVIAEVRRLVARPLLVDAGIGVMLSVMAQAQAGASTSVEDRVLLVVVTGVVVWRRRAPFATSLVVAGAVAVMALTPQQPSVFGEYLALMLVAYTVAERCDLVPAVIGGLAMVAGVIVHDIASTDYDSASAIAGDLVVPVLIWGVGRIVHHQFWRADRSRILLEQLEQDQAELAERAVAAERSHLARELHDVVTHSLSVVVIQAQGAQRVLAGDQPDVRQSLIDIESAGRTALTEMRRLLGLLREDQKAGPPGLAELPALFAQVRAAGLTVRFSESGLRCPLDPDVELSIYRIVQESLTNALKYAPRSSVDVTLERGAEESQVRITDNGTGTASGQTDGRGLNGMRERVASLGGSLEAGPLPAGGFRLQARLPTRGVVS
jgi:signal transduction histidine kinase